MNLPVNANEISASDPYNLPNSNQTYPQIPTGFTPTGFQFEEPNANRISLQMSTKVTSPSLKRDVLKPDWISLQIPPKSLLLSLQYDVLNTNRTFLKMLTRLTFRSSNLICSQQMKLNCKCRRNEPIANRTQLQISSRFTPPSLKYDVAYTNLNYLQMPSWFAPSNSNWTYLNIPTRFTPFSL